MRHELEGEEYLIDTVGSGLRFEDIVFVDKSLDVKTDFGSLKV